MSKDSTEQREDELTQAQVRITRVENALGSLLRQMDMKETTIPGLSLAWVLSDAVADAKAVLGESAGVYSASAYENDETRG